MSAPTTATLTAIKVGPNAGLNDIIGQLVAATSTGDAWIIQGRELIVLNNASGAPITVTVSTTVGAGNTGVPDNWGIVNAAHDVVLSVGAGKVGYIVASTVPRFRDSNNLAQITYSAVTSLTVGIFAFAFGA